ncbi:MAG: UDP-N-acetylmuramoyl-L-alanine--D-glutamate ligase [Candidatus Peribacteraceae bacterium]|nr:UDP-N-acetylmuramoyl-L-alanine--D-glutamate ligase [Candidatus Peribacteraceae bacterium]
MSLLRDFNGKNVCILGFGKEGKSVLNKLMTDAPDAEITIADKNEKIKVENSKHWKQMGTGWLENLDKFDIIIKSPGIPPQPEIEAVKSKLTNALQIFLEEAKEIKSTVIGITGTKGKSTVTALLGSIFKKAGRDVRVGGNIGTPILDLLDNATKETVFVVEMSSYQLMNISQSPEITIITSLFEDHLDYHGSKDAYVDAKKNAVRFQSKEGFVFIPVDDEEVQKIAKESSGTIITYSKNDSPININETKLIGEHNLLNIAGASKVATHFNIDKNSMIDAIKEFKGLPHRLENIGIHHEITWIDDSISTTPETTIAALNALGGNVETLICGGFDRGLNFSELGKAISESNILTAILFPNTGEKILKTIKSDKIKCIDVKTMEEAVNTAKEHTSKGKICLLSPASPSHNMFKNFEERGDMFRKSIN